MQSPMSVRRSLFIPTRYAVWRAPSVWQSSDPLASGLDICTAVLYIGINDFYGAFMPTQAARITKSELAKMIDRAVEEKLISFLGDPDEKLTLKDSLRKRLLRQKRAVSRGQRGEDFNRLVGRLRLP